MTRLVTVDTAAVGDPSRGLSSPRGLWAVVPVKTLDSAKQRLSTVLGPELRRRLVLAMLADVLKALAQVPALDRIAVVTRDPDVAAQATSLGAAVVREPESADLNAAISCGLAAVAAQGATQALIVPGDVPLATAAEIESIIAAARSPSTIVIAPASDGNGTNALLLPLPAPIEPAFGPGSAARHTGLARIGGRPVAAVGTAGLAHDIDTPGDLAALSGQDRYAFLDPAFDGGISSEDAHALAGVTDLIPLLARAKSLTLAGHGTVVTYSKKVFIPLTKLCRDVCHY